MWHSPKKDGAFHVVRANNIHSNMFKILEYLFVEPSPEPTSQKRHNTLCRIMVNRDQHKVNGLKFMPVPG